MRRRKVVAQIVRSAVERLESRMLLSATLNEGAGSGTISGVVYNDLNGNGALDSGEPAVAGTTVTLAEVGVNYNGAAFPTVQADPNGNFTFIGLAPGQYQLALVPDTGFNADAPGQLLVTVSNNDIVTLNLGETTNAAGGGSGTASISGTLFDDPNQTGIYNPSDPTEGFLAGDTVYLDLNGSGVYNANDPTAITSGLGGYSFNVAPGSYEVRVIPRPGFHQDAPGYLQVTVYSDQMITSPNADVGENSNVTVSGVVFQDLNGNGVQDLGEPAVAGETVFADNGFPATVSNSSGQYTLSGLSPGFHRIQIQSNAGMIQDDLGYVDITITPGEDATLNLAEGLPSTVSGVVFNDKNGNGVQDAGDFGLVAQTVYVDLSNDGIFNDPSYGITAASEIGDLVTITSTAPVNVGDNVTIENVTPAGYDGTFPVLNVTPTGFTYEDSYIDSTGAIVYVTGLTPGTNFGSVTPPSTTRPALGPDGMPILSSGEAFAESQPADTTSTPTTPDGYYAINNLGPGTYTLRLNAPNGAKPTGPANASHSYTFTLGSDQQLTGENLGVQSADLTVSVLSLPIKAILAGAPQHAVVRVTNVGSLPAFGNANVILYSQTTNGALDLSTAGVLAEDGGVPLHLLPGQSKVVRFTYSFPVQSPTNSYYITATVNSTTIEDDNPSNDFAPVIGPVPVTTPFIDLSAAYLAQPPQSVFPGASTPLSLVVTNNGNVATTGSLTLRAYITLAPQLDPTDIVAQTFLIPNARIRPGKSRVFHVTLTSPGMNVGARFIIFYLDSGDTLGETNLMNNVVIPTFGTVFY